MILIGSSAIKHWFPDFSREPKDLDYIVFGKMEQEHEKTDDKRVEMHINPVFEGYDGDVLDANSLVTLKASHLCWNINWEKHMFDVQFLLKKKCVIDKDLFLRLYTYWNTIHGKNKRSDLEMSKEDFFTNAINYNESEHDELHKILNPTPVYTTVLKDDCEVDLDENKFLALTHEGKLDFVREEVMVMAFERYKHLDYRPAYYRMLKKFIISHAPIWSVIFIIENYIELHKPKYNYINTLNNGLQIIKQSSQELAIAI